ncbi:MAG: DUF1467 family protein [Salibaculum sp.]|jgi:predicted secreted protein|uniref:DUF1467 family protein n=1 Tax=Roseovarius halophilus (ex Wu et al. 2025) TaxID=3376060 RepID=UPI0028702238|nr:DUF1467 family protein [Salibaculum sp.]MDR9427278.1 DUF1467 family protein [Salibaculum sp.]MDR9481724.1 DUF1467 family protein [Salibaculum sp.]
MGITSSLVLLAIVWFMVFFVVLPLRLTTQGEAGEVVPGTHKSAPSDPGIKRKAKITSIWALLIWALLAGVIWSGAISVSDYDWADRMGDTRQP